MKFQELKQHLKEEKLLPCYLATGEDDYLIQLAKEQFLKLIKDYKEFNVSILTDCISAQEVMQAAEVLPAFGDLRLVIASYKCMEGLNKYLASPCPTTVILLLAASKDTVKPAKGIEIIDCDRLSAGILSNYIATACKKNECQIEVSAAEKLIEYCSRFMGRISVEIDKLCSFKKNQTITQGDIIGMVSADLEYKVYELSDLVAKREIQRALSILNDMLSVSGAAGKVFGLLYAHFRRLMYVSLSPSDSNLAEKLGIKEFAVGIAKKQASTFSKLHLKNLLDRLHQIDQSIKSNKINDKLALQCFVMEAAEG